MSNHQQKKKQSRFNTASDTGYYVAMSDDGTRLGEPRHFTEGAILPMLPKGQRWLLLMLGRRGL